MKSLTESEKRRKQAALTIVKTLHDEMSVVAKPMSAVNIKHIPDSVEPAIRNWLRKYHAHEIYGSSSMATHSIHARRPNDLDIAVGNPGYVANSLASLMRSRGVKVKIVSDSTWGSYVIQVFSKGKYEDAVDIHPASSHGGKFEFYGASQEPLKKKGLSIQRSSDQLLRKFNAITQIDPKTGKMGAAPHREIKDTQDAIQITELLLASMQLKSKAQLAKAQKVKAELKVWKAHLTTLQGGKKKSTTKRKPLSATRQKKFVQKAVKKPAKDVDDFIFENGEVKERKVPLTKVTEAPKMITVSPYYGVAQSPYLAKSKKRRKRRKGKATVPYGKTLKSTHSFSKSIKKVGRRKKRKK